MKKITLLLLFILATVTASAIMPFQGTPAEALEKAKSENKDVSIQFTANWCGPCKIFTEQILSQEDVIKQIEDEYVYILIDIDIEKNKNLYRIYGSGPIPEIVILNTDGMVVNRIKGAILDKDKFLALLDHRERRVAISHTDVQFDELITDSVVYDGEKTNLRLMQKLIFAKWNLGLSAGVKFSQMSGDGGYGGITTGYDVGLLVERQVNKFTFQTGLSFNSSGGRDTDAKLISHNVQLPLSFGLDLFHHGIVGCPQDVKLFITPYGRYSMVTNRADHFNRWDIGTRASLNVELGSFELGVYYDMGFLNQSKVSNVKSFNRSFGLTFALILRQ